jgi:hypothetical protein
MLPVLAQRGGIKMPNDIANNMADTINQLDEQIKELEAKHWDECRQIAHYDDELSKYQKQMPKIVEYIDYLRSLPVNRWISVKDRLPEPEKEVLVWYRYTWGAGFTSYRFGISRWYSNIKRWYEGCLPKDIEVLYWQPLIEPPKDGDTD